MKEQYEVKRLDRPVDWTVDVPGSKSMTNRALLMAALSDGEVKLEGVLFSDDSRHFLESLVSLGFMVDINESEKAVTVLGCGGNIPKKQAVINVGSAGTAARFLTAMLGFSDGEYTIEASEQMKKRPMQVLFSLLTGVGANITYLETEGHLPVKICGRRNPKAGADQSKADGNPLQLPLDISKSTQFLSALLLISPMIPQGLDIHITSEKTDGSYIYTMLNNNNCAKIRIYSVEGKTIELVKQFTLKKRWVEELYLENSKLIILSSDSIEDNSNYGIADDGITLNETTYIDIYDVSTPQNAKKIKSLSQSGIYKTSRFTNGYLYTFSSHLIMGECKKEKEISEYIPSVNGKTMKENKIQKIVDAPVNSYVVMTSVNLAKPDNFSDTAAVLSDYTTYYMSTSHLYLANTIYEQSLRNNSTKTAISKFEYKDGAFSYLTTKKVKGQINDSYYMHEYKGNFAFVYTDWRNETSTNGICILDKNMNTLGKIDNLGNDETIYASYYIGSMAYFVTYRQTDPVFAVDISNPKKPVVKAKLKLPGFSSYLHSFGENQLIGVGMAGGDDDKVKISLFALGENGSVTEQTKLLLPKYSETEAGSNHKSVFIDEERKLVGFATIADTTLRYKLYHFDGTEFKQVLNVPIKEMSNTRGIRIGNYFYVVDNAKKIHAYDMQTWK